MSIQGMLPMALHMAGGLYPVMLILIRTELLEAMILILGQLHGLIRNPTGTDNGMDSLEKILKMLTWKLSSYLMIMKTGNISISIISGPMPVIPQEEDLVCRSVHAASSGLRSLLKMLFSGITKLQI